MTETLSTRKRIWRMLPTMVLFEIIYKLLIIFGVKPFISWILQLLLQTSGIKLAFNTSIADFFLTPYGIAAGLIVLVLSAIATYVEFAVITLIAGYHKAGQSISFLSALRAIPPTLVNLRNPGIIGFFLYTLVLIPIADVGMGSSLFPRLAIPNFVSGELAKMEPGIIVLALFGLAVMLLFLRLIFVLPIMVLERVSFFRAAGKNFRLLRAIGRRAWLLYGGLIALWLLLYGIPYSILQNAYHSVGITVDKILTLYRFNADTAALLPWVVLYLASRFFLMPVLLSVVTMRYLDIAGLDEVILPSVREELRARGNVFRQAKDLWLYITSLKYIRKFRIPITIALMIALCVSGLLFFQKPTSLHRPIVIGHRGSSEGVENTLEAVQGAIRAQAHYAEVDVQLSSDGVPMVVHDVNLSRLAGEDVNVYERTAAELQSLVLYQEGFTGRIPTLDEVAAFCEGKIHLAVEIKPHGYEQLNAVDETMRVLEKYGRLEDHLFLSLDYGVVEEINSKYPECRAGYCVYGGIGDINYDIISSMQIDFIVIEESMATSNMIYDLRGTWIPVYVWTVNEIPNMWYYLEIGAIGLISDYPAYAMTAVREYEAKGDRRYLDESDWNYFNANPDS